MSAAQSRNALIQVHFGAVFLAGSALFPRFLHIPVAQIVLLRSVIAALLLLGIALLARQSIQLRSGRDLGWLILCGLLIGLHWLTYFMGIQQGGVALAAACFYTFPVLTVFIEPLFGETRLHAGDVVAGVVALLGIVILAAPDTSSSQLLPATALSLFSAVCFALRNVLYRRHLRSYSPYSMMGLQFLLVSLLLLPSLRGGVELPVAQWWAMLAFGVFFTAAPHVLFVSGMRTLTAKTAGLINSLMPLYATAFAWLLLHETPTAGVAVGGALIVGAAFYESFKAR